MMQQRIKLFAPFVAAALLAGCKTAKVADPLTQKLGGNDPQQQVDFFHNLGERPVTSNDEAFHAVLLFTEGNDPADNYDGRLTALKQKGMLPAGFNRPADEAISKGTLAVALVKALNVKGGLMLRTTSLFGPSARYATRELQWMGVYPLSSPNQTFSGAEFLGIMAKAEEYTKSGTHGSDTVETEAERGGGSIAKVGKGDAFPQAPATQPATKPIE